MDGEALFADNSLVFPVLVALAALTGDAIVGNKVAACVFAGITAAGGAVAAGRWTGSRAAAAVTGLGWALSPLHLSVSAEFLKNSAGLALFALLLAVLPRCERSPARMVLAGLLAFTGLLVHKLTGVMGIMVGVSYGVAVLMSGRRPPPWLWGAAIVGLLGTVSLGVLRPEDFQRFLGAESATISRWAAFWSARLIGAERAELVCAHLTAVVLVGMLWGMRPGSRRSLGLSLLPLSVVVLAPGLPFGWDLTAWRLLLLGFLPAWLVAALLVHRLRSLRPIVVPALLVLGGWQSTHLIPAVQDRSPDYARWATDLPALRAAVPDRGRVVAHRGLCGFIWAEGGIICENFQPPPPHEDWWRVAYGFGTHRFVPFVQPGEPPPTELSSGYTLVWEPHWQRFLRTEGERFLLVRDPRNPFRPRPGFVYGPGAQTPEPTESSD